MPYCFAESPSFFASISKNDWKNTFSRLSSPTFFLSAHWSVVWHTWLNNFAKRQRNHSNSKNDKRKKNFFEREFLFHRNIALEARTFVGWTLKKTFWLKDPFFSSQSPKKVEIMFNFQKKRFSLKTFKRYLDCTFDNHAMNFSLKAKKVAQNLEKTKLVLFFLSESVFP